MIQIKQKIYFPIIFLLSWLGFTILSFIFGPYEYQLTNPVIFYTYLILIHLALYLGYIKGLRSEGRNIKKEFDYIGFVKKAIQISFIYFIVKLIFNSGISISNLNETFNDASNSYNSNSDTNIFSYLDMIFTPISLVAITNTIFSYKNLPRLYRYSVYVLIIFSVLSSISSATRSGIVQIAIISMAAFSLGLFKGNIILKRHQKIKILILCLVMFFAYLSYTSLLTNTRGGVWIDNPITGDSPRSDFFLNKITSPETQYVINNISFYISHSYYRLNQAMNLPFEGLGFGLSNSYFVMNNIEKVTGWSGLKEISYGVRLDNEEGDGGYGLFWSTFYTWIASDFTFPGTILVVFFIGYLFSLALKDSLNFLNPLSVTVYCILFYFIFHFAFNNPLQDGSGITTNLIFPIIWLIYRSKKIFVSY